MIRTIIFDVGEVLLGYRWMEMLTNYGLSQSDATTVAETVFTDPLWEELDLGVRSLTETIYFYEEKYPEYKDAIHWFLTHTELMHIPREDVWEKVHELKKKGYGIYLLSNYSEELFNQHTAGADFMNDIDGMVVSWQIKKAKPSPEIYLHLLDTYNLSPAECLFFDDRPANTEAARKLGMQAITVTSKKMLLEELNKL